MPVRTERKPWTDEEVEQIQRDYVLARETRRQDPPDSEKRKAGRRIADLVAERKDEPESRGEEPYTYYELAHQIQIPNRKTGVIETLDERTLRRRQSRWEKEKVPDSQKDSVYKGNDPDYVPPRVSHRTEEHFGCKVIDLEGTERYCERTKDNTLVREWDATDKRTGRTRHVVQEDCKRHYDYLNVERRRRRKQGVPPIPQDLPYSEGESGGLPIIDLREKVKPATDKADLPPSLEARRKKAPAKKATTAKAAKK